MISSFSKLSYSTIFAYIINGKLYVLILRSDNFSSGYEIINVSLSYLINYSVLIFSFLYVKIIGHFSR